MGGEHHVLHPELLTSIPFGASLTTRLLHRRVMETLVDDPRDDPQLTVVIRVFNEAATLELLLADLHEQCFDGELEIVVVDNESTDGSVQVAKRHGAEVVSLPRGEFSYPKSLNMGMAAASHDLVFVTVGHARLSNTHNLHAGARHFNGPGDLGGAFGTCLPNDSASTLETLTAMGNPNLRLARPARRIKKAGMGALDATGAMISKPAWKALGGFDDRYQAGGEDTALAKSMLRSGYGVIHEPAMAVHHSHGLGVRDSVRQHAYHLQVLRSPNHFDMRALLTFRPDLKARGATADR